MQGRSPGQGQVEFHNDNVCTLRIARAKELSAGAELSTSRRWDVSGRLSSQR